MSVSVFSPYVSEAFGESGNYSNGIHLPMIKIREELRIVEEMFLKCNLILINGGHGLKSVKGNLIK